MPKSRYSLGAMIMHWLIAIAVITNWQLAQQAEGLPRDQAGPLMDVHKALGMTILALTILRIIWRLTHDQPAMSAALKGWEVILAKIVHALFYIILISLPVLGWIGSSSFGGGIDMFGLFTLPPLPVANDRDAGGLIFSVHATMGTALILLVGLHILGALKHQFIDRNGELYRMLPFGTPKA
ncbi:cytochrome b [Altericroceibacterium endophyticum]|uniref:Cytochrome b n=1 Tax=Altericroceibacterium endophyticum TaxID=1808508 RepID=A0A6I4SZP9_9SPHN|nr:cytochrome b [Altericroceibacterium endophyticum]MXO64284.1 cytochrome b [Altericroceibacterium endophyticum]